MQNGKEFVSVECLFTDFDYAVIDASSNEDQYKIVERNQETAFLTKYMRAYGGEGVYQDKRIGRIPKNFIFSGQAITQNPANPESVIFNAGESFSFAQANIVKEFPTKNTKIIDMGYKNVSSNNKGFLDMGDELKQENDNLKAKLEKVQADNAKLVEQLNANAKKEVDGLKSTVDELTKVNVELKTKVETLESSIKERDEKLALATVELTKVRDAVKA